MPQHMLIALDGIGTLMERYGIITDIGHGALFASNLMIMVFHLNARYRAPLEKAPNFRWVLYCDLERVHFICTHYVYFTGTVQM